jgi:uncharacterized protein
MEKRKIAKRMGWSVLALVILFYVGLAIWFKTNETRLVYHTIPDSPIPADSLQLKYEDVSIQSDGAVLRCWIYSSQQPDTAMNWILYFPGNGPYDESDIAKCKIWHDLGLNVLAVRYRGYGNSTGKPDESGLYADAAATYNFLRTVKVIPPTNIVLYGHSLGTGVAIELASIVPAAGIALEGAATSSVAAVGARYPFIPWSLLMSDRYDSIERIKGITIPKIFIHASDDAAIPISQARELYAKATEPKFFIELTGGHNHASLVDREKYTTAMSNFFRTVFHGVSR